MEEFTLDMMIYVTMEEFSSTGQVQMFPDALIPILLEMYTFFKKGTGVGTIFTIGVLYR